MRSYKIKQTNKQVINKTAWSRNFHISYCNNQNAETKKYNHSQTQSHSSWYRSGQHFKILINALYTLKNEWYNEELGTK